MTNVPGYEVSGILISREEIAERVRELGRQISEDYRGKTIFAVGILKGSMVFMADLIREIEGDVEIDFLSVSSYGNATTSTGNVRITKDMDTSPSGKNILIIEDIIDTGNTLKYLKDVYLSGKGAESVKIVTLLDKPARRKADIHADYIGFEVEDVFIVGYGLDYAQKYRELPDIAYLEKAKKPEDEERTVRIIV